MIRLDLKDWKILNQLDINSRQSDAEIGKKTRISKQVVNYRIKKLIENKIITGFSTQVDIAKIGYSAHKVYLRFKSLTERKEQEIWNALIAEQSIVWVVSCSGRWDIIFGVVSKDMDEFDKTLSGFMNQYSQHVAERVISVFNKATLHHRKWLLDRDDDIHWSIGGKTENIRIDEKDKNILLLVSEDARIHILEIAKKLHISSSLVIQRIKKLQKEKIIGAYRLGLNNALLGINYCKAFIYYQNKTEEKENRLIGYCTSLKEILGISRSIGPWDLELEFEVRNYDMFHKIMKDIKNRFDLVSHFETCYIEKEHGMSFLPKNIIQLN
jgi:Lrp/AsnC family transcriptional regulator, leucine-responsive regulatory protein